MTPEHVDTYAENLRTLMQDRLRIKGKTLDQAVRRAGRRLPKWAQTEARYLLEAQTHLRHPKLATRVDPARVVSAHNRIEDHLAAIDPVEIRTTQTLRLLGVISFNLILLAALVVIVLMWRGFL